MTHKGFSIASVLFCAALLPAAAQTPSDADHTRADFEEMAARMPYLSMGAVIYNRSNELFQVADPRTQQEHFRILAKLADGSYPKADLLLLLKHSDPKVRTLAAVTLFDREDPSVLPAFVRLAGDGAATFDGHPELSQEWLNHTGVGPPPKEQTVGDFAKKMVDFYMEVSGYNGGVSFGGQAGFAKYWKARKSRAYCAGWFAVQLARASQGTQPTQAACIERIHAVRKRIDAVPPDERAWVLLWLNGEAGSDALITEQKLVDACKKLGPRKLILMLQNKIPIDDPDLQPNPNGNWFYKRMSIFVLQHADQLLGPGDSDTLLECEKWQRDYLKHKISDPTITAWWAVAAAHLRPARAPQILSDAMNRFQDEYKAEDRSMLCVAMGQLAGKSESDWIADWFYKEPLKYEAFPNSRSNFVEAMGKDPSGKYVLGRIIQDPRFSQIDWQSFKRLLGVVNGWSKTPVVTNEELDKAFQLIGSRLYGWDPAQTEKQYPKETEEIRVHFGEWRERLVSSVPEWLPPDAVSSGTH